MYASDNDLIWCTADRAALHDFGDVFRVHLYWDNGAEAHTLHDTREEAVEQLKRLGWTKH